MRGILHERLRWDSPEMQGGKGSVLGQGRRIRFILLDTERREPPVERENRFSQRGATVFSKGASSCGKRNPNETLSSGLGRGRNKLA